MKKKSFWSILTYQGFTVVALLFLLFFENRVSDMRASNLDDLNGFMARFHSKFMEARNASNSAMELALVNGFPEHMRQFNRSVQSEEDDFRRVVIILCLCLICLNILAVVTLIIADSQKGMGQEQDQ